MANAGAYNIEVPSGRLLDLGAPPSAAEIQLEDIAHKLAQINRFGGATSYPYPVAQHAVFVSRRMEAVHHPPEACLAGLHHDDGEFVVTDIQKPIKVYVEDHAARNVLGDLEALWQAAIEEALGLPPNTRYKAEIKAADIFAVLVEGKELLRSQGRHWRQRSAADIKRMTPGLADQPARLRTPTYWRGELHWTEARDEFLARHEDLARKVQS